MITALVLNLMFTVLNVLLFFVDPVTELPLGLTDALNTIYSLVHSGILVFPPLGSAMLYFILGITIEASYQIYRVVSKIFEWVASLK